MENYLIIREEIEFIDTLKPYENIEIYNHCMNEIQKNNDDFDEKTRRHIDWDKELLMLRPRTLIVNENKNRFYLETSLGEERNEFYEVLFDKSDISPLRFQYLDYLIEYGDKAKKYKYVCDAIDLLKSDILDGEKESANALPFVSRYVDLVLKFNMIKEYDELIKTVIADIDRAKVKGKYRWILDYATLLREISQKDIELIKETQIEKMVNILEEGFKAYYQERNTSLVRGFISELAHWEKLKGNKNDVRSDFFIRLAELFEDLAKNQEGNDHSSLIEAHNLENAARIYLDLGESEKRESILPKIKDAYRKFEENEMMSTSYKSSVSIEELEKFYKTIERECNKDTFKNLAIHSIPKLAEAEKSANEAYGEQLFTSLFDVAILDGDRKVNSLKSEEEKKTHEMKQYYSLWLQLLYGIHFQFAIEKLQELGLSLEEFKNCILDWQYHLEEDKIIIGKGLEHYWNKDYISAMHILVPKFENALREFFHNGGFTTTAIGKNETQRVKTFNEFLEMDFVKANLSEDYRFFIKYSLVDEGGYNLRNKIAHGLVDMGDMNYVSANIIISLYQYLALNTWS